jgi:hypothetical protein
MDGHHSSVSEQDKHVETVHTFLDDPSDGNLFASKLNNTVKGVDDISVVHDKTDVGIAAVLGEMRIDDGKSSSLDLLVDKLSADVCKVQSDQRNFCSLDELGHPDSSDMHAEFDTGIDQSVKRNPSNDFKDGNISKVTTDGNSVSTGQIVISSPPRKQQKLTTKRYFLRILFKEEFHFAFYYLCSPLYINAFLCVVCNILPLYLYFCFFSGHSVLVVKFGQGHRHGCLLNKLE